MKFKSVYVVLLFVSASIAGDLGSFKPVLKLAKVPEKTDTFLQFPSGLDLDAEGNVYVVDTMSARVFKWNADGSFNKTIGRPGNGPGELAFNVMMGALGFISISGNDLFLLDGGKRMVHHFGLDGTFKRAFKLKNSPGGTAQGFFVTGDKKIMVNAQSYEKRTPTRDLLVFDAEGNLEKTLFEIEDDTFNREMSGGQVNKIELIGFKAVPYPHYMDQSHEIILANGTHPYFEIHNLKSSENRRIEVQTKRVEVTDEDQAEYRQLPLFRYGPMFKPGYADLKPYYDKVLPYGDDKFLVFRISPSLRKIDGVVTDAQGRTLGPIKAQLGTGGDVFSENNKLFMFTQNEDGDWEIYQVDLKQTFG